MQRSRFPYVLVGVAAILLVGTSTLSIIGSLSMRNSIRWVSQTHALIDTLRRVDASVSQLDSHLWGLTVTDNSLFASRYEREVANVQALIRDVRARLVQAPEQRERFEEFVAAFEARLEADRWTVEMATSGREVTSGLLAAPLNEIGVAYASVLNTRIEEMLRIENQRLAVREADMQASLDQTISTVAVANGLALIAIVIAFFSNYRAQRAWVREREQAMEADKAIEASRQKSQFLANMSHEIRTPMNAIFGFTQLLEERVSGEEERQYVKAIATSGRSLLALINDILDLSKIEADRLELNPEPVDLRGLVDSALGVFGQMASDKNIGIRTDVAPSVPDVVRIDPNRLRQILFNLIGNAVKFTEEGGVLVRVQGEPVDDRHCRVVIEVIDTGVGIEAAMLDSIFDEFVQTEAGQKQQTDGTGLGLSIARRMAQVMGGDISATSKPGEGSVFRVSFPELPIERRRRPREDEDHGPGNLGELPPASILIVDDVEWNRQLLVERFRDTHHRIDIAADGVEALEKVRAVRPDLVLMDIRMPRLDGRDALARIREDRRLAETRVVAVTASSLGSEEAEIRERFDGYLRKPFTHAELFDVVSTQLEALEATDDGDDGSETDDACTEAEALDQAAREELEELARTRWPRLRTSLRMREAGSVGEVLARCGERLGHRTLRAYGRRLSAASARFDVTTVQSLLEQFPSHVEELIGPLQDDERIKDGGGEA